MTSTNHGVVRFDYDSNSFLNFVGNHFRSGPSTESGRYGILTKPGPGIPQIYIQGSVGPHRPDSKTDEWAFAGYGYGDRGVAPGTHRSLTRYTTHSVTATSATEALEKVLAEAGSTAPKRDAVDRRVVTDVTNRTGAIINSPDEVGGYPKLASGDPPVDSDHDGMPDDWESMMGLDPNDAADGNRDLDEDGYTNIEEYLHSLIEQPGAIIDHATHTRTLRRQRCQNAG